jgi:hypothetical protein
VVDQYKTINMAVYDNKGDASLLKAKLDEAKKNDLRRSHFDVGGESYAKVTENRSAYRPMSANMATLNRE